MAWSELNSDTDLLEVVQQVPADVEISVHIDAFEKEEHAFNHENVQERCTNLTNDTEIAWDHGRLRLTKRNLTQTLSDWTSDRIDTPYLLLTLSYSGENGPYGSHYALLGWGEDRGLHCPLCSLTVQEVKVKLAYEDVLAGEEISGLPENVRLVVTEPPPQRKERVFVSGGGGDQGHEYQTQVRAYVLLQEFGEEMDYDSYPIAGNPQSLRYDDETIVTLIDAPEASDGRTRQRIQRVRLFPPNTTAPVTSENLNDSGRKWLQWYPVERYERGADPANTGGKRGMEWVYEYLKWRGRKTPKTVVEFTVFSHAIVRQVTHFETNGDVTDFHGNTHEGILKAFAEGSCFRIMGCNSDTSTSSGGDLIHRHNLGTLEGVLRARARLVDGLRDLHGLLRYIVANRESEHKDPTPTLPPLHDGVQEMEDRGRELFGSAVANGYNVTAVNEKQVTEGGTDAWQVPSEEEMWEPPRSDVMQFELLREYEPLYDHASKTGSLIKSHVSEEINTVKTWINNHVEVASGELNEAIETALRRLKWEEVKTLKVGGWEIAEKSIQDWVKDTRKLMSSDLHYAASFAHLVSRHERNGIRVFGGNPGLDAQHLKVEISVSVGDTTRTMEGEEVSAYVREPSWSRHCRPWLLAFYRRFAQSPSDPFGYFRYDRRLDEGGDFKGWSSGDAEIDEDLGFNYGSVHISPEDLPVGHLP